MNEHKVKDWKQQFFKVKIIGPEPKMTPPPWKQYRPPEVKAVGDNGHKEPDTDKR